MYIHIGTLVLEFSVYVHTHGAFELEFSGYVHTQRYIINTIFRLCTVYTHIGPFKLEFS